MLRHRNPRLAADELLINGHWLELSALLDHRSVGSSVNEDRSTLHSQRSMRLCYHRMFHYQSLVPK